jgi:hypothetical protein
LASATTAIAPSIFATVAGLASPLIFTSAALASVPSSTLPSPSRSAAQTPSLSTAVRLVSQPGLTSPSEVMNALVASPWLNCS